MAEWTSPLPWLAHQSALAGWAAARWWRAGDPDWPSALALLAAAEDEGHTALDWTRAGEVWERLFPEGPAFALPPPDQWPAVLFSEGWLVLEGHTVQTRRNHDLETRLVTKLKALAGTGLARSEGQSEGQNAAVARAGLTRLLLLAGGPGTGKTTTLKRLVAAWNQAVPGLRTVIAAPTGRAAARAAESFAGDQAPKTLTLHRLLGLRPGLGEPRYGPDQRLPFDLVIVDEASMLDLRTAAALADALAPGAALVLVGDPGQLPSVEAGSVLPSLLSRPEFAASTVRLTQRFRLTGPSLSLAAVFDRLAATGDVEDDLKELLKIKDADFRWEVLAEGEHPGRRAMSAWGPRPVSLETIDDSILLSPVHDGPGGTRDLTVLADRALGRAPGTIDEGLPWMITRNLPHLGLANGDRGLLVRRDGALWWVSAEHPDPWPFALVADGQAAWAISVHKSQGSEYNRVVLVLPPQDSPVISRELLYTGLTRAKSSAVLVASVESVRKALGRRLVRMSGLD